MHTEYMFHMYYVLMYCTEVCILVVGVQYSRSIQHTV